MPKSIIAYDKDLPEISGRRPWEKPTSFSVLLAGVIGVWAIIRQINRGEEIAARTLSSAERIAEIAERIDARLRRQYADIDRDLQEIKELLGGQ